MEWGGHDAVFGFQTAQPELANHVMSTVGAYPLQRTCDDISRRSAADFDRFVGQLELAAGKKGELTLDLLAKEDWDLFVQVFGERGQHARSAVGMGSLPSGITVEIEAIVEVE